MEKLGPVLIRKSPDENDSEASIASCFPSTRVERLVRDSRDALSPRAAVSPFTFESGRASSGITSSF
jgi:hypothetical protein